MLEDGVASLRRRFSCGEPAAAGRTTSVRWAAIVAAAALLGTARPSSGQQQGPINPQVPPPPPVAEAPAPTDAGAPPHEALPPATPPAPAALSTWKDHLTLGSAERATAPLMPPPDLPDRIAIPAGTRIPVVLETPLSTRFSRKGQTVIFRTSGSLAVGQDLEIPPGTEIRGRLAEVSRPGVFGKSGALSVTVERIALPAGSTANLRAQLRSPGMNARGRLTTEARRSLGLQSLMVLSLQGTLAGAQFGSKAAGIGAGAGAAIAAVLMMSQRGRDVSIAAGTPFSVRLREDLDLPAQAVFLAQQDYARTHPSQPAVDGPDAPLDGLPRPVLKRRSASPQP